MSLSRMKLSTFLKKNQIQSNKKKKNESVVLTHTRMGDTEHNVIPGSFSIAESNMDQFWHSLYNDIIEKKGKEYLTEFQLKEDGGKDRCIAIDFDFNYELGSRRHHNKELTFEIICSLLSNLRKMYDFASTPEKFNLYVFERDEPYECAKKKCTKDGLHIIIGIKSDNIQQNLLRDKMLIELPSLLSSLPLINTITDVYDSGISGGSTNWQVIGCRKPGIEPYKLAFYYTIEWDFDSNDFISDTYEGTEFDMKNNIKLLSVRNKHIPLYALTDEFEREYQQHKNKNNNNYIKPNILKVRNIDFNRFDTVRPENICEEGDLIKAINMWFDSFGEEADIRYGNIKYKLKEIHEMVMILPDEYADNHDKWLRVGWALFNTSSCDYMFYSWMLFSAKSNKFSYDDISYYYSEKYWNGFQSGRDREVTAASIIYWAREYWKKTATKDEDNKYLQIKNDTLDHFIDESCKQTTDFDLAKVLYHFCKDKFVCIDIKNSTWYEFKNHKFKEIDSGVGLSLIISTNLHKMYFDKMVSVTKTIRNNDIENDDNLWKECKEKLASLSSICIRLRDVSKKEKIMKAAKELFYDPYFINKIDANPKFLGCNNGIIDFEQNIFRGGDIQDYVSKSTKIDYIPYDKLNSKVVDEINNFMDTLFPIPDLCEYMWQMLASCLVGNNKNQSFHIFTGGGSNGKSLLMKLMKWVLGEYYGVVPLSVVTEKRPKIGGVSPEIMNLIGTRLAVINEPSRGDKINEGPMKALTGGDDIQGRGLFKNSVTFTPTFKLAVCTNVLFDIDATDEGTWRRIKVVPFLSHFVDKPDPEKEFEYKKDLDLEDKMKKWVEPLFSMLVNVAFKTKGLVLKECGIVNEKSNEYRNNQDHIMNFIDEKIVKAPGEKIKKGELSREFEDWFKMNYGKRGAPKAKDIHPIMDKMFGKYHNLGWHNIKFVNENDDDEEF